MEKMASTATTPVVPELEWSSNSVLLKDFLMKNEVPNMGKITKGQFMGIGVSKNPLKRLQHEVVIHSIKTSVKVLAHSVVRLEGRDNRGARLVSLDQRLSIPLTYQGWFELLSEDGRSARPIQSVLELAKSAPDKCLVRENIKAYLVNDEGKFTGENYKIIPAGEQLLLAGEITIPLLSKDAKVKLLRCFDSKGTNIYLSFDQKGSFSPVALPGEITGVFTMKEILKRFRLPLTVKLVLGVWPKVERNRFTGLVRLDWVYTDETAFLCPLDKNLKIFPVPTEINMRLVPSKNIKTVAKSDGFTGIMSKCNRMVNNYNNTIHLIISVPESVLKTKSHTFANLFSGSRRESESKPKHHKLRKSKSKEDFLMDEVDDLYQFLRVGQAPPKNKFTYDSDEESYWEEPAYEPIDDFRARLKLLESGQPQKKDGKYKPADIDALKLDPEDGSGASDNDNETVYNEVTKQNGDIGHNAGASGPSPRGQAPPQLPPRKYTRTDSAPLFVMKATDTGSVAGGTGSCREVITKKKHDPTLVRREKNRDSMNSQKSRGSRDSKEARSSKTGSGSGKRKSTRSLPFLYL